MSYQDGLNHFSKHYDDFFDVVGSMDDEAIRAVTDKVIEWVFCDGMEPLLRSEYLTRVNALDLSKALTKVLEKEKQQRGT
jgi:hypothetical protein